MTEGKTWTDTAISNIWIPPGTGKGYKLQVIVNGVPSRPIRINYDAPRISKIVDESGAKLPSKGGTAGGMLLTFTGANFGCLPTEGTIGRLSDKDGAADGMLSQQELAKYYAIGSVYDSASSTGEQFFEWKDDILVRVEDSDSIYDAETIRTVGDVIYAYDANRRNHQSHGVRRLGAGKRIFRAPAVHGPEPLPRCPAYSILQQLYQRGVPLPCHCARAK
jgi:hypothetical protein